MLSYASGYFEGQSVLYAEDPGVVAVWKQAPAEQLAAAPERMGEGEDPPVTPANPIGEAWPLGRARGRRHHPSDHLVIKTHNVEPRSKSQWWPCHHRNPVVRLSVRAYSSEGLGRRYHQDRESWR